MLPAKRYLILFFSVSSISLGGIALINSLVDPFGDSGLVPAEFKPIVNERAQKYSKIILNKQEKKYSTYIIGSSSSMQMSPQALNLSGMYNFSVSNIKLREVEFLVDSLLGLGNVKKIIFGLDFANLNKSYDNLKTNPKLSFSQPRSTSLLSFDSLKLSIKTLKYYFSGSIQDHFNTDGSLVYSARNQQIKNSPKLFFSRTRFQKSAEVQFRFLYRTNGTVFEYNKTNLKLLERIRQKCELADVKFIVFLPIFHRSLRQLMINDRDLWRSFQSFKTDLFHSVGPYWDFTLPSIFSDSIENFYDAAHANRQISGIKLKLILGESPAAPYQDLGKYRRGIEKK